MCRVFWRPRVIIAQDKREFVFYWEKTENKLANLCSVNLSLLSILFAFFTCVLLLFFVFQVCREVISKWQSWCWALAWGWPLILFGLFSACFGDAGPCNMAPIIWVCLGEAGAFPYPPRLGKSTHLRPWTPLGSQFCLMGPAVGLASF